MRAFTAIDEPNGVHVLNPADIESRDFLVVVHGYHKTEVRAFLAEIAANHAELLAKLEAAPSETDDDFDRVGSGVANILRAAKESAAEITSNAEEMLAEAASHVDAQRAEVAALRADALREADELRTEAEARRADAVRETEALRAEAATILDDARATADRIELEAATRARTIEIEAEANVRNRLDEVRRREGAIRDRLLDLSEELRMAQLSLDGDAGVDVRERVDAIATDTAR